MESLRTILIANRGEIAVRIMHTAKSLSLRAIAIYTAADASSSHVGLADESVLLSGSDSSAYLDGDQILSIARDKNVQAVVPGYGFLSENADFARQVKENGIIFVGPSEQCINDFGIKHRARELAQQAGVPIVPGSKELLKSETDAVTQAEQLGFPVMLKATAGGGGMGLVICQDQDNVRDGFKAVQSRGKSLFKNPGVFLEKYYPDSHHIEVQVFGNGKGQAIHFGERECSIQRRHQKVIEECPSPLVQTRPELRSRLCDAAVRLAESISYGSAGTVEYLVDDKTGDFFFLEMNTRLQVEHGITELCYNVDLVELMLKQADAELCGKGGLDQQYLWSLQRDNHNGHALEARIYAEKPTKDYAPSPGRLQKVEWKRSGNSRIDTWINTGTNITSFYDPLLAKAMVHAPTRGEAIRNLRLVLTESKICGPPTNMGFLAAILDDKTFESGKTLTKFLEDFAYQSSAIEVLKGGSYTLVEDWPGRPTIGRGFGHAGPMDPQAFRIANALVGNDPGTEGLEITLTGPDLKFLCPAVVSFCGAPMTVKLNGRPFPMWTRVRLQAGDRLTIGKTTEGGCRAYLAIYGGFPSIAAWFGSKSTATVTGVGGYQGRALAAGDMLEIVTVLPEVDGDLSVPEHLIPKYPDKWELYAMSGPYDIGFLTKESMDEMWQATWTVSHNAARGGIRLMGPKPKWAREDGGEGGAHPSNVIEYGYPLGAINWTGDEAMLFPVDAPDFGGFVTTMTVIKQDFWKIGQLKAGNEFKLICISPEDADKYSSEGEQYIRQIQDACKSGNFDDINPPRHQFQSASPGEADKLGAIIHHIPANKKNPITTYRRGGDNFLLVEYGEGSFDLNYRCRAIELHRKLQEIDHGDIKFRSGGMQACMPCGNSLMIHYIGSRDKYLALLDLLIELEASIGDLSEAQFPSRLFKLPITFSSKRQTDSIKRYMETQRPYASYLPSPLDFVAKNNAMTPTELKKIFTESTLMVVAVGFFVALPIALPIDPRQRIQTPKMNPSRVHTPEGQVGWGGSCMALYNVESPGGYMNIGLSIPGADVLGFKPGYSSAKPWLFDDFDRITFYEVSDEDDYEQLMDLFRSGQYEYEFEEGTFDMKEHNALLAATRDEVEQIRAKQRQAQQEMDRIEKELLQKWNEEKQQGKISTDTIEELLSDPAIIPIEAPMNANVWKIQIETGQRVELGQILTILEAMKMEIPVRFNLEGEGAGEGIDEEQKTENEQDSKNIKQQHGESEQDIDQNKSINEEEQEKEKEKSKDTKSKTKSENNKDEETSQTYTVEKILVAPNDVIDAGKPLVLLRRG